MINVHEELVSALERVLPTHYELKLTSKTTTPCISYQEINNSADATGDTIGYSRLVYQVKVWANNIADIQHYSLEVDKVLRPMGFKRTAANELHDPNSSMIQKILTFEALGLEEFDN